MIRLGICEKFVRLIMKCVSSVRFSVKVNDTLLPYFQPTKGLRQGDPMSPFLFLICAEGFTLLLNNFGGPNIENGKRVSVNSQWVKHLGFADDCIIFLAAQMQSAGGLNEILRIYSESSGQAVNKDKSYVFFNSNASAPVREAMKQEWGILTKAFTERYLGLPTAVGRITSGSFEHIGERSRSNMQGWAECYLACAGREIMLKSVNQAIPTHSMSCFKLTKKVCNQLTIFHGKLLVE